MVAASFSLSWRRRHLHLSLGFLEVGYGDADIMTILNFIRKYMHKIITKLKF